MGAFQLRTFIEYGAVADVLNVLSNLHADTVTVATLFTGEDQAQEFKVEEEPLEGSRIVRLGGGGGVVVGG